MAKTIEEICKDLAEWADENPAERSVMAIIGENKENIIVREMGMRVKVVMCMASTIIYCPEFEETITIAMDMVKERRKEKQQEIEDN